jgi:hypothetical protein
MAAYLVNLIGQRAPAQINLPFGDVDELAAAASRAKFLIGHLTNADEDGVCRRVMISTCRIESVVEL